MTVLAAQAFLRPELTKISYIDRSRQLVQGQTCADILGGPDYHVKLAKPRPHPAPATDDYQAFLDLCGQVQRQLQQSLSRAKKPGHGQGDRAEKTGRGREDRAKKSGRRQGDRAEKRPNVEEDDDGKEDDDMYVRSTRDANLLWRRQQPRPPSAPAASVPAPLASYLRAGPDRDKYRSRFLPMRAPDLVKDDLAYRAHVCAQQEAR